jgi:hypothetical protein
MHTRMAISSDARDLRMSYLPALRTRIAGELLQGAAVFPALHVY